MLDALVASDWIRPYTTRWVIGRRRGGHRRPLPWRGRAPRCPRPPRGGSRARCLRRSCCPRLPWIPWSGFCHVLASSAPGFVDACDTGVLPCSGGNLSSNNRLQSWAGGPSSLAPVLQYNIILHTPEGALARGVLHRPSRCSPEALARGLRRTASRSEEPLIPSQSDSPSPLCQSDCVGLHVSALTNSANESDIWCSTKPKCHLACSSTTTCLRSDFLRKHTIDILRSMTTRELDNGRR